jgi:hypothetical protein
MRESAEMSKSVNRGLIIVVPALLMFTLLLIQKRNDERMYHSYEQVANGMNLARVEDYSAAPVR